MYNTRGRIINGYLKFVKKKWGADGVKACVAWSGAFMGILQITGNKDGHVEEIECEHEGGKECVFKLVYKK